MHRLSLVPNGQAGCQPFQASVMVLGWTLPQSSNTHADMLQPASGGLCTCQGAATSDDTATLLLGVIFDTYLLTWKLPAESAVPAMDACKLMPPRIAVHG